MAAAEVTILTNICALLVTLASSQRHGGLWLALVSQLLEMRLDEACAI